MHNTIVVQTIEKAKQQQWKHYFGKESRVPDRIVSLHKPYLRPVVRGRETKPVEFGAKVNKVWIDGICFMEHLSFNAFHEGIRFQSSTELQRRYFGECPQMGADALYATNENRTYCRIKGIATCFVATGKQGPQAEQKAQMRQVLGVLRGTRPQGSFGREKQYYLLDRISALGEEAEVAWIFFGYLAANAVTIARRRSASRSRNKAA